MAAVIDVAKYILEKEGPMTSVKLQKLVYYSHAWTLVWDERPLITARIEAWANGAVIPSLFRLHRRMFKVDKNTFPDGESSKLTAAERENIDKVLSFYGKYSGQQLSDINHQEKPWVDARKDLPPLASSTNEITDADIILYYSAIPESGEGAE